MKAAEKEKKRAEAALKPHNQKPKSVSAVEEELDFAVTCHILITFVFI